MFGFWSRLTGFSRIIIIALLVGGGYFVASRYGLIPEPAAKKSVTLGQEKNVDFSGGAGSSYSRSGSESGVSAVPVTSSGDNYYVSATGAKVKGPQIRFNGLAWMAQMGLHYAMGGEDTVPGSIFEKYGVNMKFIRNDDVPQQQAEFVKFAVEYCQKGVKQPTAGYTFVSIMGDSAGAFLAEPLAQIEKLGTGCGVEIVGSAGRSFGEDKMMGPPEWKQNPQNARGALIAGVSRDGDWNVSVKWAVDNGICINPDEKTYDSECLNFVNTNSFTEADDKYIAGFVDTRVEVKKGRKTGRNVDVQVNGVLTWTPGDVTVATKKGGVVTIASTREYMWQMPHVVIGNKQWMAENRPLVESMLTAIFDGGEAVKTSPKALKKAAAVMHAVYKEPETSPEYWERFYKGDVITDKQGLKVEVGGSGAHNLADNLIWFGLTPGGTNMYKRSYEFFGGIAHKLYPDIVKSVPPYEKVVNTTYLKNVAERMTATAKGKADMPVYSAGDRVKSVVSKRSWQINFDTGKATFTRQAMADLEEMFTSIAMTGLAVEIHGYTDNVGSDAVNQPLSDRRATAVRNWLINKSPEHFSDKRFAAVQGHGASNFVADNSTGAGRAFNRRVEIVLGQK